MKDITDNKNIEDIVSSYRNINLPLRLVGLLGKSRMTLVEADEIDEFMVGWLRTTLHHQLQKARKEMLHKLYLCAIGKYEGDALENVKALIKEYHSELDQDKK